MASRPTRDQWAMELALVTKNRTTCLRRQVGCVLLSNRGHVLSTGYNGVAAGLPHCNELASDHMLCHPEERYPFSCSAAQAVSGTELDGCQAIHAEQNALLQCRDVWQIHTCYVTTSPCITCTKLLLNTSCERIVFIDEYPHQQARELWEKSGRVWMQLST